VEFVNNIYADRSVLQENLTLMDSPYFLNGIILTFRGFVVFNTLTNSEFLPICRMGNLYDLLDRTQNCSEILLCEFLFKNDKFEDPVKLIKISNYKDNKEYDNRNKILATLHSQREFSIFISLDILGKSNCSYDPFYQKRAEDLITGILKRGFGTILNNELSSFGIKPIRNDSKDDEENIFNDFETEENKFNQILHTDFNEDKDKDKDNFNKKLGVKKNHQTQGNNNSNNHSENNLSFNNNKNISILNDKDNYNKKSKDNSITDNLNININNNNSNINLNLNLNLNKPIESKFKGYIDNETKVNIIQFSCFDDSECVLNTTDIYADSNIFQGIYKIIFNEYAKIQTNINKLKNRNKQLRLRKIFNYENLNKNFSNFNIDTLRNKNKENINLKLNYRNQNSTKNKITKENFLRNLKVFKINEYAIKFQPQLENNNFWNLNSNTNFNTNSTIWICCKIYEHQEILEEGNLEEFSDFKIIFVSYESIFPVDIDSFCQDLLINEYFI
jgi:hypothetical protein